MYVITFKGKPTTVARIYREEGATDAPSYFWLDEDERGSYIACPRRKDAIDRFLFYIGFTWKERAEGIDVHRFEVTR